MKTPSQMDPPTGYFARHRITHWRLVIVTLAAGLLMGAPAWSEHWLAATLRIGGIVLVCAAAMGRMWCALYISGRKSKELVTQGPYSICRHPLYLFNLLGFVGIAMLSESLLALAGMGLAFAALYPGVIASEDRLLADRFAAFREYRKRTPALIPQWSLYSTPSEWTVSVGAFLRNIGDSLWFPLLAAAVELVDVAHEFGWLDSAFVLY